MNPYVFEVQKSLTKVRVHFSNNKSALSKTYPSNCRLVLDLSLVSVGAIGSRIGEGGII
jgi:hypothetical protein